MFRSIYQKYNGTSKTVTIIYLCQDTRSRSGPVGHNIIVLTKWYRDRATYDIHPLEVSRFWVLFTKYKIYNDEINRPTTEAFFWINSKLTCNKDKHIYTQNVSAKYYPYMSPHMSLTGAIYMALGEIYCICLSSEGPIVKEKFSKSIPHNQKCIEFCNLRMYLERYWRVCPFGHQSKFTRIMAHSQHHPVNQSP